MNLFGAHACRSCCNSWPAYTVRHADISPGLYIHEITYKATNIGTFNQTGITAPSVHNQGCCYLDDWYQQNMGCDRYPEVIMGKHYLFYSPSESSGNLYKYKTIPVPQNNHISGNMTIEDMGVSTVYHQQLRVHKINEINLYQSGRSVQFRFSPEASGKSYTYSVMGVKSLNGIPHVNGDKIIYYASGENDLFPGTVDRNEDIYINLKGALTETFNTFRSGSAGSAGSTVDLMVNSVVSPRCGVPYVTGISGDNNGFVIPPYSIIHVSGQWSEAFFTLSSDEGDEIVYIPSRQNYEPLPLSFYNSGPLPCSSTSIPFTLWGLQTSFGYSYRGETPQGAGYGLANVGVIDGPFPSLTGNDIQLLPGYTGGFDTSLFGQSSNFYDINKTTVSGQERINHIDFYHLGILLKFDAGTYGLFPSYNMSTTTGALNSNDRPPYFIYYRTRFTPTNDPVICYYQNDNHYGEPLYGDVPIKGFRASDFPNGHVFCPWEGVYNCEPAYGGTLTLHEYEANYVSGIPYYTRLSGNYYSDIYCSGDIP